MGGGTGGDGRGHEGAGQRSRLCCLQASKKKVYMLYNLQPDRSVTGGAWYSDQDFESEFVEVLNQQCFKFLQSKVGKEDLRRSGWEGGWMHVG